ncbi:hypothetical protein D7Z54_02635 [Salibacterium salarium]|uniref:Uncharacterized protein n=1 Tax=Salibacterium salarium TaxID=284579 RepID=A0A3R9RG92_9BACI|nr:hypothetical protein [Salibacterium salarium]RSL34754.1 hypothetical protein D7Z54_02635 [Salibacterium salarium]
MEKEGRSNKSTVFSFMRVIACLFMLLAVYYIFWSAIREEDFSSIILYSSSIGVGVFALEKLLLNHKSYIYLLSVALLLCIFAVLEFNVSGLFYFQ